MPAELLDALASHPGALERLVRYHIVRGVIPSAELADCRLLQSSIGTGIKVEIDEEGNYLLNGSTQILISDVATDNGIIYVIDSVCCPGYAKSMMHDHEAHMPMHPHRPMHPTITHRPCP